jgi:hypothetical protein
VSEILLLSNPSRRHKKRHKSHKRHGASRRYHRNPSFSIGGIFGRILPTLKDGALGAVGGVATDAAFGFGAPYLPEILRTGLPRHGVKLLTSVLIGALGGMVLKGKGNALAVGGATVVLHDALKEYLAVTFPTLPLGEFDQPLLGWDSASPVGEYMRSPQMGAMPDDMAMDTQTMGEYMG